MERPINRFNIVQTSALVASVGAIAFGAGEHIQPVEAVDQPPSPQTEHLTKLGATALIESSQSTTQSGTVTAYSDRAPRVIKTIKQKSIHGSVIHHSIHPPYSQARLSWLYSLRMCESSGDYRIDTGNGFKGAYQFTEPTWDSLHTGYDHANQAPPRVQDRAIIKNTLISKGGISTQNPGCYLKLRLSMYPPK